MKPSPLRHPARRAGASLLRLQSDARLAELAVAGHEAAFDAIVDRYRTPLTRYCAGIVGPSRAEDAAQQALINAHDALQRTDEVRHLRSWLYRIAHNVSLNVLRAVRDDVPLEEAARAAAAHGADEPAETFERSERFRETVAALRELPERQRAALVLRELEGRSHAEIAEALGVTKGSARQHLMRARVAVRGAVTAVTPYPLIVRLADGLAGSGGGAGWADAAVGAGAGATIAKLTAGVAATGALVGGAVGTSHVVHHDRGGGGAVPEAIAREPERATRTVSSAATVTPASLPAAVAAPPARAEDAPRRERRSRRARAGHTGGGGATTPLPASPDSGDETRNAWDDDEHSGRDDHARDDGSSGHGSHRHRPPRKNAHDDTSSGKGSREHDSGKDAPQKNARHEAATDEQRSRKDSSGKDSPNERAETNNSGSSGSRPDDPSTETTTSGSGETPSETTSSGSRDASSSGSGSSSGQRRESSTTPTDPAADGDG